MNVSSSICLTTSTKCIKCQHERHCQSWGRRLPTLFGSVSREILEMMKTTYNRMLEEGENIEKDASRNGRSTNQNSSKGLGILCPEACQLEEELIAVV